MTAPFPTAQQLARAVVMAAQFSGEDPETILTTTVDVRARNYALAALVEAFPEALITQLANALNFAAPDRAAAILAHTRKTGWWREGHVDEIVGALVASEYGERAL